MTQHIDITQTNITQFNNGSRAASPRLIGTDLERCLYCLGTNITKKGRRYKKHETVQLWHCRDCTRVFTPQQAKGKTYPLKVILESLCYYYRGHTKAETLRRLKDRFGLSISPHTLSLWLAEYKPLTTYARLRKEGSKQENKQENKERCKQGRKGASKRLTPHQLIRSTRLHHKQVYTYRYHRGKSPIS